MNRVRVTLLAVVALAAVGAPLVLLWPIGSSDGPGPPLRAEGGGSDDPPYPYCLPDASPPPRPQASVLPSFPPPPRFGDIGPAFEPIVDALVEVSSLLPTGETTRDGELARVEVSEVLWEEVPDGPHEEEMLPIPVGTILVADDANMWADASEALAEGSQVALGLDLHGTEGAYGGYWAITMDPTEPEVFRGDPWLDQRDTATLRLFLAWEANPFQAMDPVDLIVAWNAEAEVAGDNGPIATAWDSFVGTVVIGIDDGPDLGSAEYWAQAPPECRTMEDAPPGVQEALAEGSLWIRVPASWHDLQQEAVLCVRTPAADQGCDDLALAREYEYLDFVEVYAVPGSPVEVQITKLLDGTPSWIQRVTVATVPWEVFSETGFALVELDPTVSPSAYSELEAAPQLFRNSVARSLTAAEFESYFDGYPRAEPVEDA